MTWPGQGGQKSLLGRKDVKNEQELTETPVITV